MTDGQELEQRTAEAARRRNMLLLTHLRWIAAGGQLGTILVVYFWLGVGIPILPMSAVVGGLVLLNIATLLFLRLGRPIGGWTLLAAMLLDFASLSLQLFMSGGATNPFASIGLLQIVLGAVLLETWSCGLLVLLHSTAFGLLAWVYRPLPLPTAYIRHPAPAQLFASWINFTLVAILILVFSTRASRNLRSRDARLADMRRREAEEDHVVRIGLLASGAAHELGTPLASVAVILGDWSKQAFFAKNETVREEIAEMRTAIGRCKKIISDILYASGEARSEAFERLSLRAFLTGIVGERAATRPDLYVFDDRLEIDPPIVADKALGQIIGNVLDNSAEAGATHVRLTATISGQQLVIIVRDDGPGFPHEMLETVGQPYRSSKDRRGAGLGLFLAFNVMRKLGGSVEVRNGANNGAAVTMRMPLAALSLGDVDV